MGEKMKDFLGACLLGAVLGAMLAYGVPAKAQTYSCLLYTSPSPRDLSTSRMPSSA